MGNAHQERGRSIRVALIVLASCGLLAHGAAAAPAASPAPATERSDDGHALCTTCHRPGVAGQPACASCHAAHAKHLADPAVAGAHSRLACTNCHDPHADASPSRLRSPRGTLVAAGERFDAETRLCVSCHFEAGQFRGMGGGFVRHPVGVPAPAQVRRGAGASTVVTVADAAGKADVIVLPLAIAADGRAVLGCGTCHTVHGAAHPYRLRWARARTVSACASCHQDAVSPLASRE